MGKSHFTDDLSLTSRRKLKMAREKLHHLQELVKVVQQGGGPHLPIDDLEDLTLTLSEDIEESEYGESEEEGSVSFHF